MHSSSPSPKSILPFVLFALAVLLLVGTPAPRTVGGANSDGPIRQEAGAGGGASTGARRPGKWVGGPRLDAGGGAERHYPNTDVRLGRQDAHQGASAPQASASGPRASATARQARAQTRLIEQGVSRLKETAPGAEVTISPLTGGVEMLGGAAALSGAAPGRAGADIVRGFIREHMSLYGLTAADVAGLRFIGESVSGESGLRMVRVEQVVNGAPVFQSETRFILDREGRVIRSVGLLVPGAAAAAPALGREISAAEALQRAMASVDIALDPARMRTAAAGDERAQTEVFADSPQILHPVQSRLVYFPAAPGVLTPAWSQVSFTGGDGDWYTLVDARNGALLWRKNIRRHASTQEARFSVYVQADGKTPADSPAPQSPTSAAPGAGTQFNEIARSVVKMLTVQDVDASPSGWLPDGGSTTTGNNVDAYLDRVSGTGETNVPDVGALDNNGRPVGNPDAAALPRDFFGASPRNFGYAPAPLSGNPNAGDTPTGTGAAQDAFRRGAVTQLFYVANWYHDRLYRLGFDEAAGNFQLDNFGRGGLGNDRLLAEAQDGSFTNNPDSFAAGPDGTLARMQVARFTGPSPDRDAVLDSEVVIHELTHGLTDRLIGNTAGLEWGVGRGLAEGWSDFYALSLLNNTNADDPGGRYAFGAYTAYQLGGLTDNYVYGLRRFPYSTDNAVNPLTWADTDDTTADYSGGVPASPLNFERNGAFDHHNVGEVWALSLWEARGRVIAAGGGDVPAGNQRMLQIVTDALKMTPNNPSYVEARDALFAADCAANACANEQPIWEGFADRGLGYKAVAPLKQAGFSNLGHMSVGESFSLPYLDFQGVTVDDSAGNNNGAVDPGEPIRLTVTLRNPWRAASKGVASATATLTTTTPGVTVFDGASAYPAIPAQGSAAGDTFLVTVPTAAAAGQALKFTVTPTSALGSKPLDFTLRVGKANGVDPAVTYTRTPTAPVAIPDGNERGVTDTLTVADDLEIADLNFRVDSLSHTFTGDLTVLLRAPNGYGSDLIWLREIFFGGGDGDNFVNTVIDDQSANDLSQSASSAAPYTGDWKPAFNSPVWTLFGDPAVTPDPVGQLSRLNGMSTRGDWTVLVADNFNLDSGTLNAWSLVVTPVHFDVTPFTPAAAVSGTKTAAGTFAPGGAVTYTVTLANTGTGAQADNPGAEFTDVLPSQLTLVGASASSGVATATVGTNTVTWNGGLAPLGGAVTITITATANAGSGGQTASNQGSISFDAGGDGTNESSAVTDDPTTAAANDPTVILISCPSITVGPTSLANGTFGVAYSQTLTASGGAAPYNFSAAPGALPAGLSLSAGGELSGAPAAAGSHAFTVAVTDASGCGGSRAYTLTVAKADQLITFGPLGDKTFGDADFAVSATTDAAGLAVSYAASGDCTVTGGGTVHLTGAGVCAITAFQGGDSNHNAAAHVQRSFNISKGGQTISFGALAGRTFGDADFAVGATASSGLPVSFAASGQCSVAGSTVHLTGAGSCTLTASQAGGPNHTAAPNVQQSFDVGKAASATAVTAANAVYDGQPHGGAATATGFGGLNQSLTNLTYTGRNGTTYGPSATAPTNAGDYTASASFAGDADHAGSAGSAAFRILKASQTINFAPLAGMTFGDADFAVGATASSGLPVTFTAAGRCTVTGATVHLTGAGPCAVTASQSGDANHRAAPNVERSFDVAKAASATVVTVSDATYDGAPHGGSAVVTGAGGLSQSLTVTYAGRAGTVYGPSTSAPTNPGGYTASAAYAGDADHTGSGDSETFSIAKADQAIVFNALADRTFGDADFDPGATASSGLPVVYTATGACTILAGKVHINGAGVCAVTAKQDGDDKYNAAPGVSRPFTVNKRGQSITFAGLADKTFGDAPFDVSATGGASGNPVTFTSQTPAVCSLGGATVTILGGGLCTVRASQSGGANYNAAPAVDASFQVAPAATSTTVSSTPNPSGVGEGVTYTATVVSAAGAPGGTVRFFADGVLYGPTGVPCVAGAGNSCAAELRATPLPAGAHAITAEYLGNANFQSSTGALSGGQAVAGGGVFEFAQGLYTVGERGGSVTLTVKRGGDPALPASVDYATDGGGAPSVFVPCAATTGLASERCDFTRAAGVLHFAAGESQRTISVLVNDDSYVEGAETVHIRLSNPSAGAALGAAHTATLEIADDAAESAVNVIDDTQNFVRQHYHDFLGREPDADGLAHWTSQLAECGSPDPEVCRVNVSAAFFLSIEFQNTGYLVERMHKTAYGDAPGAPQAGAPSVRLDRFLNDTRRIGGDVVVGRGDWAQQLEANKNAFALEFVRRPEFLTRYPAQAGAATFVYLLDANAGGVLSPAERDALILELSANPADAALRASVLRKVAEDPDLVEREFGRAFVLMQYFGYLRRDPDAALDASFDGYQFWLSKLDEAGGDFIRAEMVKAFLSSDEYRKRFGQ